VNKAAIIFNHEFTSTIKRKGFILVTLAIPFLLLLGYGIYEGVQSFSSDEPSHVNVGYVDYSGIFDEHTEQQNATLIPYESEEEAKQALLDQEIDEYLVIKSDYLSTAPVSRYTTRREMEMPGDRWSIIRNFLVANLIGSVSNLAGEDAEVLQRISAPVNLTTTTLEETGEEVPYQDDATKFLLPVAFGLLFVFALMFSAGSLFQTVTEEKENRVIEILLSSVSSKQLLAGKILGLGVAGLIQVAVWLGSLKLFTEIPSIDIPIINDLSIPIDLLLLGMLYFIFGYLMFAALFAALGSIAGSAREAQQTSGILVIPAVIPLWFNYFISSNPEGTFAKVLTFIPLTAPMTAMMRLPVEAIATWELVLSYIIMAGAVLLFTWIAAKMFRTYLLMYGKGPSLREIVRHLRQA